MDYQETPPFLERFADLPDRSVTGFATPTGTFEDRANAQNVRTGLDAAAMPPAFCGLRPLAQTLPRVLKSRSCCLCGCHDAR
jgi:hypothetical protein